MDHLLHMAPALGAARPERRAPQRPATGDVLVVDDSAEHADAIATVLRGCGYGVRVAATGCDAIAEIAGRMPDMVVVDVGLPDIDGFDVCRLVRRLDPGGAIPVIFVSAVDSPTSKLTAFAAGAIDYVVKPFVADELLARVSAHLGASLRRREAEENARELEAANRMLAAHSFNDPLTGAANRRHFEEALAAEWRRALRARAPLGLVMLEPDYYPGLGDASGTRVAGECLRRIAEALRSGLRRPGDSLARLGGERFAALLPDTDECGAAAVAESLRRAVERLAIINASSPYGILTASAGVAAVGPSTGDEPGRLIRDSEDALRRAAAEGRNRVSRTGARAA